MDFLELELASLEQRGLLRRPIQPIPDLLDACSNDYLGYARAGVARETLLACEASRAGAGASRLIHGTAAEHKELESELADWVGLPAALTFSSGYAANVGVLSALMGRQDVVFSDELNHASIIDGCRLSGAEIQVVPHLDLAALERELGRRPGRRCWVVTETYFSMDGDSPDLRALREVCDRQQAPLIVDEAHALGVHGPGGSGLCRAAGVAPDVLVGTLGKALGVQGAFVAGSESLCLWLWNRARSLVFSTAPSPLLARIVLEHVRRARRDDAGRAHLAALATELRAKLAAANIPVLPGSRGAIVPIILGDNHRALAVAERMREQGILAQAIRPPTVPDGQARLRVTVSAAMSEADLDRLARCLIHAVIES